jgi:hypothetical protein
VKLKSPKLNGGGRGGVWGMTTNLVVDATTVRVKAMELFIIRKNQPKGITRSKVVRA